MTADRRDPVLVVEGLCAAFPTAGGEVDALDDVSFTLAHGEVLALVGEAESGASIAGHALVGLVGPPGRVSMRRMLLNGVDLTALDASALRQVRGSHIAVVFADPATMLDPLLRIGTQMVEAIRAHDDVSVASARARARAALARLAPATPDALLDARPHELAATLRQRVAVAIALLHDPDVIIADDLATALDATEARELLRELRLRLRETDAALLGVTRDPASVSDIADRVCVMYAGRVVEEGTCEDVLVRPAHPYTQGLLDSIPAAPARARRLRVIPGSPPSLTHLPMGCAFRARCALADAACLVLPPLQPAGGVGQTVRCVHPLISLY